MCIYPVMCLVAVVLENAPDAVRSASVGDVLQCK